MSRTIFSAVQPSGDVGIGHYVGAIRHWLRFQKTHRCFFAVADLHAITVPQEPERLREKSYDLVAFYLACGLDQSHLFVQSHVPQHNQLAWLLMCSTSMGELKRMTQFKDKSARHPGAINAGLFTYPVLMAADVLLYQSHGVPVGDDQKQHLELVRHLAQSFNTQFGAVFVVPESMISDQGARLMGLQDPTKKMSKSDANRNNYIALNDPMDLVEKKIKRAVTDSHATIEWDESRPAVANLLTLFSAIANESIDALVKRYHGHGYAAFKKDLAACVVAWLEPLQKRFYELRDDKTHLDHVLAEGAQKAREQAEQTLKNAYEAMGMIPS